MVKVFADPSARPKWARREVDGDPGAFIETLDTNEMLAVVRWVESQITSRDGYLISCKGSCAKGPQGIWWDIEIAFEAEANARDFYAALSSVD